MSSQLSIFLRDHEAAARAGLDLVRRAARNQRRRPWGDALTALAVRASEDLASLHAVMARLRPAGPGPRDGAAARRARGSPQAQRAPGPAGPAERPRRGAGGAGRGDAEGRRLARARGGARRRRRRAGPRRTWWGGPTTSSPGWAWCTTPSPPAASAERHGATATTSGRWSDRPTSDSTPAWRSRLRGPAPSRSAGSAPCWGR